MMQMILPGRGDATYWNCDSIAYSARAIKNSDKSRMLRSRELPVRVVQQFLQPCSQFRRKTVGPFCVDQADVNHVEQMNLIFFTK